MSLSNAQLDQEHGVLIKQVTDLRLDVIKICKEHGSTNLREIANSLTITEAKIDALALLLESKATVNEKNYKNAMLDALRATVIGCNNAIKIMNMAKGSKQ